MINLKDLPVEIIPLSDLKDKNGRFKYDESSEQFGMSVELQYDVLKESIRKKGQEVPILIWRERIVDGRNRCKALDELDIDTVDVKKLLYMSTLEERMELAKDTEYGHRHETPTQLACNAVKEFFRLKKLGKKVTEASVLKNSLASAPNFRHAKWIHENQPMIFDRLFKGELVKLDDEHRPTQSLAAIANVYKKQEKEMDDLKKQLEMDEELAISQLDQEDKEDKDINYNGKLKIYQAIDIFLDPIIESSSITIEEYLVYKYGEMKRGETN